MAIRVCGGAERRRSDEIVEVILGAFRTHSATHSGTDCRPSALVPQERIRNAQLSRLSTSQCPRDAENNLHADVGAEERAKVPYFGHFARSDVEGLDGLHQLVWPVEAVWRTVIFSGALCTGSGPN